MKKLICLFLILISLQFSFAQGYKISVKIKNLKNAELYLGYYFANTEYMVQSIKLNDKGEGTFEGKDKLSGGIYIVGVPNKFYFDIVIDDKQNFSFETDTNQVALNLNFKGSPENELFSKYNKFMINLEKELSEKQKTMKNKADSMNISNELGVKEKDYWTKVIKDNPKSFTASLLRMKYSFEKSDSVYLNEIDFTDAKLLRTPMFYMIIRRHIANYIETGSEKIIYENEKLLKLANQNKEVFQFVVSYLLDFYSTFYKIGMNDVFSFLAEKYFIPDKATWLDQKALTQIEKMNARMKASFVGQPAPDLKMETIAGDSTSLYQVKTKYIMLVFWSLGCGHCETANFAIREKYPELKKKNVEIYSVNIDTRKDEWIKYCKDQKFEWINCMDAQNKSSFREMYYICSSPIAYLIDGKRTIIARRYGEEQIKDLVEQILKNEK